MHVDVKSEAFSELQLEAGACSGSAMDAGSQV